MTGTEEPVENDGALGATLADSDASVVVGIGGSATFSQSLARKAFAIVGLERKGVPGLALDIDFVLVAGSAGEG